MNVYMYCGSNPLRFVDSSGLEEEGDPCGREDLIAFRGSGKRAFNDYNHGRVGWGIVNTASFISDVALVKSVALGQGKGAVKGIAKRSQRGLPVPALRLPAL